MGWTQKKGGLVVKDRVTDLRKAIRANCIDCMGTKKNPGYLKLIDECSTKVCHLWPYRFGITVVAAKKRGKEVEP